MDLIAYFRKRKREAEEDVRFVESLPGYRLLQQTDLSPNAHDITEQHKQRLRDQIAEFDRMLKTVQAEAEHA